MYCWGRMCGRKYRFIKAASAESSPNTVLRGAEFEQEYVINDADGLPVRVTLNEFLHDFVVSELGRLGEEVIAGKVFSEKDITDRIIEDMRGLKNTIRDPFFEAKSLLLEKFLSVFYNEDNVADGIDSFEKLESEIYSGLHRVLKVKHGSD